MGVAGFIFRPLNHLHEPIAVRSDCCITYYLCTTPAEIKHCFCSYTNYIAIFSHLV